MGVELNVSATFEEMAFVILVRQPIIATIVLVIFLDFYVVDDISLLPIHCKRFVTMKIIIAQVRTMMIQ